MGGGWEPIARHIISENKFSWGELPVDFNALHVMPFLIWPQFAFHGLSLAHFFPNSLHTHTHIHTYTHNDSTPGRPGRFFDSLVQAFQSFNKDVLDTLICSGHTEMSKTWLDHVVEEIKSNRRSTWSLSVWQESSQAVLCIAATVHILKTSCSSLCIYISLSADCEPPQVQSLVFTLVSCTWHSASGLYILINCTNEF